MINPFATSGQYVHHVAVKFSPTTLRGAASADTTQQAVINAIFIVWIQFIFFSDSLLVTDHPTEVQETIDMGTSPQREKVRLQVQAKCHRPRSCKHL